VNIKKERMFWEAAMAKFAAPYRHLPAMVPPVYYGFNMVYLLTPWSRVLLEKLTGLPLVKKFSAFYGTRRFITAFTSARHMSLS
jgi:hypothetical protein